MRNSIWCFYRKLSVIIIIIIIIIITLFIYLSIPELTALYDVKRGKNEIIYIS